MNPTSFLVRAFAVTLPAVAAAAQTCYDQGSLATAARLDPGPVALGCALAPSWPAWHVFTPAHREPAPHPGFNPGNATAWPRLLVTWRCTGFLLVPVVPVAISAMGYVLDRAEHECGTP